jgi:RND family efflux transporter MFP subunit
MTPPGIESAGSEIRRDGGAASTGPSAGGAAGLLYESGHDANLWAVLAGTDDAQQFCQSWLAIQCRLIPAVEGGVVLLLIEAEGSYAPAAVWPDVRRDMSYLTHAAQRALVEQRGLVSPAAVEAGKSSAGYHVAYPIEAVGKLRGVVVLHVGPRSEAELQHTLRQLHWGAAGLEVLFAREVIARETAAKERLQSVLELTAAAAGQERFSGSAMTLATQLADRLHCERVSIGFARAGRVKLAAVSHSAHFKERTNLLRAVSDCIEEAVDQGSPVAYPPVEGMLPAVTRAHEALTTSQGVGAVLTVPMAAHGKVVGAITLERAAERPFDLAAVELCEALAGLAGPVLDVHRREDQLLVVRAGWWVRDLLERLFGPRHLGFKLGALIVAAVLALLIFGQGDFRVSATSSLEPLVQQAAVAPFNGYIREAPVRAGDVVKSGTVLAELEDRELKLERMKWLGQQEELLKQLRQTMATHDPAQTQVLSAQLAQNRAQLARVEDQLARTRIVAPFDGVVVSGDLTQQLGAPVERGTVLFEIAPMSSFRLILKVDERDIAYVKVGQTGTILLSAFPQAPVPFAVEKITPVSTPKEGRNYFRVEASFDRADPRLRPGMEGVGKIEIDRRGWLWIWTHDIWESIRLYFWKWLP